ncbi:glycosyl transferase, partial [Methylobacterium frigidaeris]
GGYGHRPNVDAALWLVDAVMPEIEALGGALPCLLVGSDMPDSLRSLQRHEVDPVGHVADLAALFDRVRLTVAPLRFGAGVKGKVLDSLAAGIPCVCTPAAAEGMDLPHQLLDLVAATPDGLARSIRALHDDEALNRTCSEAGLAYIAAQTDETRIDGLMAAAIGRR